MRYLHRLVLLLVVLAGACGPNADGPAASEDKALAGEGSSDAGAPAAVSCTYSDPGAAAAQPGGTPAAIAEPDGVTDEQPYDELDLRLAVNAVEVPAGCEITGWLLIANNSGDTVLEAACELSTGGNAIIPIDEPDAELWNAPVADCEGDHEFSDGFEGEFGWFEFVAATKFGEQLPPGEYRAALELDGWSGRFELPVTVTPNTTESAEATVTEDP